MQAVFIENLRMQYAYVCSVMSVPPSQPRAAARDNACPMVNKRQARAIPPALQIFIAR